MGDRLDSGSGKRHHPAMIRKNQGGPAGRRLHTERDSEMAMTFEEFRDLGAVYEADIERLRPYYTPGHIGRPEDRLDMKASMNRLFESLLRQKALHLETVAEFAELRCDVCGERRPTSLYSFICGECDAEDGKA
jgi:hypothetical protein